MSRVLSVDYDGSVQGDNSDGLEWISSPDMATRDMKGKIQMAGTDTAERMARDAEVVRQAWGLASRYPMERRLAAATRVWM